MYGFGKPLFNASLFMQPCEKAGLDTKSDNAKKCLDQRLLVNNAVEI